MGDLAVIGEPRDSLRRAESRHDLRLGLHPPPTQIPSVLLFLFMEDDASVQTQRDGV